MNDMMHFVLGQDYGGGGGGAAGFVVLLIYLAIFVLVIAGLWKVFVKAGQPGWAAIVPIYNLYILLLVVNRPWWWLLLMLIPFVSLIVWIIAMVDLAKSFGKSILFAVGLIFLGFIFIPILGFGSASYTKIARA